MKTGLIIILLTLVTLKTLACTCIFRTDEKSIKRIIREADLIIHATALPNKEIGHVKIYRDSTISIDQVKFNVKEVLKGKASAYIDLDQSENYCAASFRNGETYLIFAFYNKKSKKFETGACLSISEWTKRDLEYPNNTMKEEKKIFAYLKHLIVSKGRNKF
jgi:hypothetical protein